jgi:hypothetical protein
MQTLMLWSRLGWGQTDHKVSGLAPRCACVSRLRGVIAYRGWDTRDVLFAFIHTGSV